MKAQRYIIILMVWMLLTSCDLLGIGGGDHDNKDTPSVAWKTEVSGIPVIENNSVYVLGVSLTKVALETGGEQWQMPLQNADNPLRNLLFTDEAAVVGLAERVQAFKKEDGSLLWSTSVNLAPNPQDTSLVELTAGLPMAETSSRIFIGGQDKVVALKKAGGAKEFDIALDTFAPNGQNIYVTSLVTAGNAGSLVFAATEYEAGNQFQSKGNLIGINSVNGEVQWSVDISDIADAPTVFDVAISRDRLIVLTGNIVTALDAATGTVDWQSSLGDELGLSGTQLVIKEDAIFVNAILPATVLRLNNTDGAVIWKTQVGDGDADSSEFNTGKMVFDSGRLYYPSFSNNKVNVTVVEAEQGSIENTINVLDIIKDDPGISLFGGLAVKAPYLVEGGAINTYGIKLQ